MHHPEEIDRLFVTYCILHNIILEYDGYDNWEEIMFENDECINVHYGILETIGRLNSNANSSNDRGFTRSQYRNNDNNQFSIDIDQNNDEYDYSSTPVANVLRYYSCRDNLVEHYRIMCKHRLLSLCR